ncbi:AI-2E family transporter [Salinimicrobium xinjiangense]|uniref:AI-2E family transporter n=1 Tax=Salinimicrobium xinjiangense TaxID=438596 RepID=UPI0012EBBC10|nr:AI-2E family transporter [Salinimicrobium xinjiangense]
MIKIIHVKLLLAVLGLIALILLLNFLPYSRGFLAPIVTGVVLALIILPLSRKMERSIFNRSFSSLISTIVLFLFSLGILSLCSLQIKNFVSQWPDIKETMSPEIEKFKTFVFDHTAINKESLSDRTVSDLFPFLEEPLNEGARAAGFLKSVFNFMGVYLLTFVYIFFILYYRQHFKKFLIKLFPKERKLQIHKILSESADVVQKYLLGRLILMGILAVLYSIGLGLSGVDNFILISIIAAILTIIPWIGNIIGLAMAMVFGYLTSGDLNVLWGVIITFTVSQFVESYILQPYVVGDKVGLHPFFVILFVMLGAALWGLIGMVLAIPVMAIFTVVFRSIDKLKPLGFLFGKNSD